MHAYRCGACTALKVLLAGIVEEVYLPADAADEEVTEELLFADEPDLKSVTKLKLVVRPKSMRPSLLTQSCGAPR
ncbi:MAG: hypothetical protein IPP83_12690 [Flavobacteriales bacterium]|nr:hypothetical protein [Flavobacteriales bacterium]